MPDMYPMNDGYKLVNRIETIHFLWTETSPTGSLSRCYFAYKWKET